MGDVEQPDIDIVLYPIIIDDVLTAELWRAEHEGDHVFIDGRCSCGRLDLGIVPRED